MGDCSPALFAYLDFFAFRLVFIYDLDAGLLAYRARTTAVIRKRPDASTSMCFGHIFSLLLWKPEYSPIRQKSQERVSPYKTQSKCDPSACFLPHEYPAGSPVRFFHSGTLCMLRTATSLPDTALCRSLCIRRHAPFMLAFSFYTDSLYTAFCGCAVGRITRVKRS